MRNYCNFQRVNMKLSVNLKDINVAIYPQKGLIVKPIFSCVSLRRGLFDQLKVFYNLVLKGTSEETISFD